MKRSMIQITALLLILIMSLTMVGCGNTEETVEDMEEADVVADVEDEVVEAEIYDLEEVKQKLIEMINIDESEITVEKLAAGSIMSYGDWEIWFDSYFLKDPKNSQEFFDIQTMIGTYDEKIIDEANHKIWIENEEEPGSYTMVAMKGNFVITIRSDTDRDTIIETLNLQ